MTLTFKLAYLPALLRSTISFVCMNPIRLIMKKKMTLNLKMRVMKMVAMVVPPMNRHPVEATLQMLQWLKSAVQLALCRIASHSRCGMIT
jgi:hypothetical protein